MTKEKSSKKNRSSNDNTATSNPFYLDCIRDINEGVYKSYLRLAKIYEEGHGVKKDIKKSLEMYEKYYKVYGKLVPVKFQIIEFLIDVGNKHMELKNKYRAAQWYMNAIGHIMEAYSYDTKKQNQLLKKYKLQKLLAQTGCEEVV
jgi:TPR repeat protein